MDYERIDHDGLFKVLLTTFFVEFLTLFAPHIVKEIDLDKIEFLDKEIFTDLNSGEKHAVDLLVKVHLRGRMTVILIHVENQSYWASNFPERMFQYFALLHTKFGLPIYPIAVFSFDRPLAPVAEAYELQLFDRPVLKFQYHAIQLNTLNWRQFIKTPNPVASALMTKMKIDPQDRPRVKLECLRMLATLKLDPARTQLIGKFMNAYLKLTSAEMRVYNQEMRELTTEEKEFIWPIENEWTEMGEAKGRVEGEAKGRVEGKAEGLTSLVIRRLTRQFGEVPSTLAEEVRRLNETQIDELIDVIHGFKNVAEAQAWMSKASNRIV